jgi:hypothetical protein
MVIPLFFPDNTGDMHTIAGTHGHRSLAIQRPQCGGFAAVSLFSLSLISAKVTYKEFDIANGHDNRTNETTGAVDKDEGFESGALALPGHSVEPHGSREQC